MIRPQRRPVHLLIQVTSEQRDAIRARAKAAKMPVAMLIRKTLFSDPPPAVSRWTPPAPSATDRTPPPS